MMDENLRRAMKISLGDQMLLITRPILRRLPVRRRRAARRHRTAGYAPSAKRQCGTQQRHNRASLFSKPVLRISENIDYFGFVLDYNFRLYDEFMQS
jgi:hypothetical protein